MHLLGGMSCNYMFFFLPGTLAHPDIKHKRNSYLVVEENLLMSHPLFASLMYPFAVQFDTEDQSKKPAINLK